MFKFTRRLARLFTAYFAANRCCKPRNFGLRYVHNERAIMWIYEHPTWPTLTWDAAALATQLATVRHLQGRLLGRMQTLGFDLQREATLAALSADVMTTSAIEGEALNREDVRSSIAQRLGLDVSGLPPMHRDVDGIVEVLLDATRNYAAPLSKSRLCRWHQALFPYAQSGITKIKVGDWRPASAEPMQVISGALGRETVHFQAPAGERLADDMRLFIDAFNRRDAWDPIIKAGVMHLWFVTIHPFDDGNGRLGRALADMLLARADGTPERFYSMSAQIEKQRRDYYNALEAQQRSDTDVTPWLGWFLACLEKALQDAETLLEKVLFKAAIWDTLRTHPVNDRQRKIINRMLDDFHGFMRSGKYAKIAKCSTDTARRDMQQLVEWGVLVPNSSGGRSTSYRLREAQK